MKRLLYLLIILNTSLFAQYNNTIYIDPTNIGDLLEDGSFGHPYDSWDDVSISSNTIYLQKRGTTYVGSGDHISCNGDHDVKIGAYGPGNIRPVYRTNHTQNIFIGNGATNIIIDSLEIYPTPEDYTTEAIKIQAHNTDPSGNVYDVLISNCIIHNCEQGIRMIRGVVGTVIDTVTIRNCEIYDVGNDGIFGEAKRLTIENNYIHRVNIWWHTKGHTEYLAGGDGIQIGGSIDGFKILNNIIDRRYTSLKFCIILGDAQNEEPYSGEIIGNTFYPPKDTTEGTGGLCLHIGSFTDEITIARNYFSGRASAEAPLGGAGGIFCYANIAHIYYNIFDSIPTGSVVYYQNPLHFNNNTFVSNNGTGPAFNFGGSNTNGQFKNNLFAYNGSNMGISINDTSNNLIINNSNTSLYNSYLSIENWGNGDFRRTLNLNDGENLNYNHDIDGNLVSSPPEIGAYEYYGTGQSNNPPNINNQEFGIGENTLNGSPVGTIIATDPDQGQSLTYSIESGNTDNAFQINSSTGELSVNNSVALNYEMNPEINLTVQVQDNGSGTLTDQAIITVYLSDLNELPEVEDQVFSLDENTANNQFVGMILAYDPDNGQILSYDILSGNTDDAFQLNSSTGELTVKNSIVLDYETNPEFNLTIQVQDNGAGTLTDQAIITVNLNNNSEEPVADFTSNTTVAIAGDSVYFQDESINSPTNWIWQFDGAIPITSFEQNPIVTYNNPGIYNVGLVASNSQGYDILIKEAYIEVLVNNNQPLADFTSNTTIVAAGDSVIFQDNSLNFPTNWIWQFEGGFPNTSYSAVAMVTYNIPGIYNVQLIASNPNGSDELIKIDYIEVVTNDNPPVADFSTNTTDIIAGESTFFQDESMNLPTNWIWQFEGGIPGISYNANVVVTYNNPGVYNVKLVASNANGTSELIKTDYINVVPNSNPPVVDFSTNINIVEAGGCAFFQDESDNFPTNWIWQFEGGSPGVAYNPSAVVTYNNPGIYDVKLIASNSNGFDELIQTDFIEVVINDNPPVANFSSNTSTITEGETVVFVDESLNFPTNWSWQFEGGSPNISYNANAVVTYNNTGTYNVNLVASNSNGIDELIKTDYIEVIANNNPPIADFSANSTIITAGENAFFVDESLNFPTNWVWQFEGGSPSVSYNPNSIVIFNIPGIYNVKLIASNANGSDELIKEGYIEVIPNMSPPVANFSSNSNNVTVGDMVVFKDESLNFPTNWYWVFEGGTPSTSFSANALVTYNIPGQYNVKLVASNFNGSDILIKKNFINVEIFDDSPQTNFSTNTNFITAGQSAFFHDESLDFPDGWFWHFEGGIPETSAEESPVIAYNEPGIFNVSLITFNSYGYDTLIKKDYIQVFQEKKGETLYNNIEASDEINNMMILYPNPAVTFINLSLPNIENQKYTIRIYGLSGELVKEMDFSTVPGIFIKRIDISNFKSGTYVLHLSGGETTERKKFFKL